MNENKYIYDLEQYHQWLTGYPEKTNEELAKVEVNAKKALNYNKEFLLSMTTD